MRGWGMEREEKCAESKADVTDGRAADAEADDVETGMNWVYC